MLSRVLIAIVLANVVGTATGQPSVVGTPTAEEAFPRGHKYMLNGAVIRPDGTLRMPAP